MLLDLKLDRTNAGTAAEIIYGSERGTAEALSAIAGVDEEIGDETLEAAEFQIEIESQNDVASGLTGAAHDPYAAERAAAQEYCESGFDERAAEADTVEAVIGADEA